MKECKDFLLKHGIDQLDDYSSYHYSWALYCLYVIQAMEMAEDIENGILIDFEEAGILLENLHSACKTMEYYKNRLQLNFISYDIAEKITLMGCRLEQGKIIGSKEDAEKIARMWIRDYREGKGNPFAFEVGVYILFLLREEVDYSFLGRRHR